MKKWDKPGHKYNRRRVPNTKESIKRRRLYRAKRDIFLGLAPPETLDEVKAQIKKDFKRKSPKRKKLTAPEISRCKLQERLLAYRAQI